MTILGGHYIVSCVTSIQLLMTISSPWTKNTMIIPTVSTKRLKDNCYFAIMILLLNVLGKYFTNRDFML